MSDTRPSIQLLLMRLDLDDKSPLHSHVDGQNGGLRILEKDKHYQLLATVLDSSDRATSAPIACIDLSGSKREAYNYVLRSLRRILDRFYLPCCFVDLPETYTNDQQTIVNDEIARVGRGIYELFQTDPDNPVRAWLAKLLEPVSEITRDERAFQPVTIITNDFAIPWFWLKRERYGPFLCEVCPVGMQQLSAAAGRSEAHKSQPGRRDKSYEAVLVKGSSNLPFLDEELRHITATMSESSLVSYPSGRTEKYFDRAFTTRQVERRDDIPSLSRRLASKFRVVHFSGHYSGEELLLGGKPMPTNFLQHILKGSLLVLDGCSSASELDAWTDVESLTSTLINEGALGCIVTVLPVKHDPIVGKVLWQKFYLDLRRGAGNVGEALLNARLALRDHLNAIGSKNPAWLAYQLIGSPAVQFEDGEKLGGPDGKFD